MSGRALAANAVNVARDCIAQNLSEMLGGPTVGRVSVALYPWDKFDPPGVVVHHAPVLYNAEEEGDVCRNVYRFEAMLAAGTPGNPGVSKLIDYWAAVIATPGVLAGVADYSDWPAGSPMPVVEEIRGARAYDVFGPLLVASVVTIKTEIHIER